MSFEDDRGTLIAFVLSAVLAGGNGIGIRFSNRELDPLWGAGLRFGLAAALFAVVMFAMRLTLPRGRTLAGVVVFGLLQFAATYALAYYALVELHAGFGQILLALVPLMALLLAIAQGQERLRLAALGGTILALAGVGHVERAAPRLVAGALGARRAWERALLRRGGRAGATLPSCSPGDDECRRHDSGGGRAPRGVCPRR